MNLGLSHQESLVQKSLVLRRINQHSIQLNSQSLILYILNTIEHISLSQCHPQSNLSIPDLLILFPVGCPGLTPFAIQLSSPPSRSAEYLPNISRTDFSTRSQNAISQLVAGANDQVLAGTGIKKIHLRIMWAGYEHLNFVQSMPASTAISRGQLGASIALQFWSFITQASKSSTTNHKWQISEKTIPFERIFLIALYSLGDGIWQTDVAVDF